MKQEILQGDSLEVLRTFADESVDCVITSPPYFGLRDYGTAKWTGGNKDCDHKGKPFATKANINKNCSGGNDIRNMEDREFYKDVCGKCGAKREDLQIGLEETPEVYVAKLVEVFREVKRVLKKEGTFWLNLGDSYWANRATNGQSYDDNEVQRKRSGGKDHLTLKPKDLIGIPWRVAFALQADGWYLRQDIIWHKPNPMPESVTDRCTKSHEYIFLFSKNPKYYFDNEAIKEPATSTDTSERDRDNSKLNNTPGRTRMGGLTTNGYETRNKRSVWTTSTKPFKEAHFATFPETLIEPMILAGCPKEGIVLDPFFGAGTTGVVAKKLGRNYLGIELNPEYIQIAQKRIAGQTTPLL